MEYNLFFSVNHSRFGYQTRHSSEYAVKAINSNEITLSPQEINLIRDMLPGDKETIEKHVSSMHHVTVIIICTTGKE